MVGQSTNGRRSWYVDEIYLFSLINNSVNHFLANESWEEVLHKFSTEKLLSMSTRTRHGKTIDNFFAPSETFVIQSYSPSDNNKDTSATDINDLLLNATNYKEAMLLICEFTQHAVISYEENVKYMPFSTLLQKMGARILPSIDDVIITMQKMAKDSSMFEAFGTGNSHLNFEGEQRYFFHFFYPIIYF